MSEWTIKNYKSLGGEETDCFTATLYRDGKRVGLVKNYGTGGPNFYDMDREDFDALHADADKWVRVNDGWWSEFVKPETSFSEAEDVMLGEIIEDMERIKIAKRILASKIVIATGGKMVQWSSKKHPEALIRRSIAQKYPDAVILNDIPVADAATYLVA